MKDQQEIRGVNSKFSLDRAREQVPDRFPQFSRGRMGKRTKRGEEGGNVERGRMKKKEKIMEKERKGERESEKGGKKEKKRKGCWTFAISSLSLSLSPGEGSFHFSPFYGEWNL